MATKTKRAQVWVQRVRNEKILRRITEEEAIECMKGWYSNVGRAMKTATIHSPLATGDCDYYPHTAWHPYSEREDLIASSRSGCKVSWVTMKNEADAKVVSEWARIQAAIKSEAGYDFGYCGPGSITKTVEGWEVCLP